MDVVMVAGGRGTRMAESFPGVPKALVPLAGTPLMDMNISWFAVHGSSRFVICTGYLSDVIEEHVARYESAGLRVRVNRETEPRGTAGALHDLDPRPEGSFIVAYGDVLALVDVSRLAEEHEAAGADVTLVVHPNDHPEDSDLVSVDGTGNVVALHPKGASERGGNLANAGIFVMEPHVLDLIEPSGSEDLFHDLLPRLHRSGLKLRAFRNFGFVKDVGTPNRRDEVEAALISGTVAERLPPTRRPAVFLDRDGVIVEAIHDIASRDDLRVLKGAPSALRRLNEAQLLTVLVTNQPVVARGGISESGLQALHRDLELELGRQRAYLDRIYYCPHHPESGFEGEVTELKIPCLCRKPATGMGIRALEEMPIDIARSFMVGDSFRDRQFGRRLGVCTLTVRSGEPLSLEPAPQAEDPIVEDLSEAATFIVDSIPSVRSLAMDVPAGQPVLIGGRSRSGKTMLSAALSYWFSVERRSSHAVSLDRWIVPPSRRPASSTVFDRYQWDSARPAMTAMLTTRGVHTVPRSDVRRRTNGSDLVVHGESSSIIVDGPLALLLDEEIVATRIYVEADEDDLSRRFSDYYRWKGSAGDEIAQLARSRTEETEAVEATRERADIVVRWEAGSLVSV